jgi:lipopolysaccharide transport system permease protein
VSGTFLNNAAVFGKVYFSRMVSPISTAITGLLDFGIQFILLILLSIYYMYSQNIFLVNGAIILVPFVLLQLMLLAIGIGIIISSLTTKYRDLNVLVGFGMQIWMYASPIIYSLSMIPDRWLNLFMLNPVTPGILIYKYAILGVGYIPYKSWAVSWLVTIIVDILGLMLFNKTERTFMDTV